MLENFPATERKLDELRLHQQNDEVCRNLFELCTEGWPDKSKLNTSLKPYWSEGATITVQTGFSKRSDNHHPYIYSIRHPGQNSCRTRRKPQISWKSSWLCMVARSEQANRRYGYHVHKMLQTERNHAEPMTPLTLPERPWQKIGVDLFHHSSREYIIAVDN